MSNAVNFRHNGATARIRPLSFGLAALTNVYSKDLGKGYAKIVVRQACDYADENGIILLLHVQASRHSDPKALDNYQLVDFYKKFGFEIDDDASRFLKPSMKRFPHA